MNIVETNRGNLIDAFVSELIGLHDDQWTFSALELVQPAVD